jgi:uncharacterized membrane protein HdeD (DUF308 family)
MPVFYYILTILTFTLAPLVTPNVYISSHLLIGRYRMKRYISIITGVSFIALATSGMMMIFIGGIEIMLRMHLVHNFFGIVMSIAGIFHIYYNFKPIKNYLKNRWIIVFTAFLLVVLIFLYGVGLNEDINLEMINQIEAILKNHMD